MRLIGGFVTEQIAVRASIEHRLIGFTRELSERQRYRTVRELGFDLPYQMADHIDRECAVLTALHDKGAEAERIAFPGTIQYLRLGQPVAVTCGIGTPDTAVIAVVAADIADFDQSSNVHIRTVYLFSQGKRFLCSIGRQFVALVFNQIFVFLYRQAVLRFQPVNELLRLIHRSAHWSTRS